MPWFCICSIIIVAKYDAIVVLSFFFKLFYLLFEGLLIVFPTVVVQLVVTGSVIMKGSVMRSVPMDQGVLNIHDFYSGYRFIGYTPTVSWISSNFLSEFRVFF